MPVRAVASRLWYCPNVAPRHPLLRLPERTFSLSLSPPRPYFIRPLSTFPLPPGFCLAPTFSPPSIAPLPLVPFSQPTHLSDLVTSLRTGTFEEEGKGSFPSRNFSRLPPPPSPPSLFFASINTATPLEVLRRARGEGIMISFREIILFLCPRC